MEKVVPQREWSPKREYTQHGLRIECRAISSYDEREHIATCEDKPVFVLDMPSEKAAEMLMNDLYYGEYTGA
jgi:hypothetical protein